MFDQECFDRVVASAAIQTRINEQCRLVLNRARRFMRTVSGLGRLWIEGMNMFRTALLVLLVTGSACVQAPPDDDGSNRPETHSRSSAESSQRLPEHLLGTWTPYSEGYQGFGDLTIGPDFLTWGTCLEARYRLFRTRDSTHYLELLRLPPCKFGFHASFLVLVPSNEGLEVSVCREKDEFNRASTRQFCSWGILYRKHH